MKMLVQSLIFDIFDIQISHWPPVAVYIQLSSHVSKWLVTNNCKVIPPVSSKKKLQWKNAQPHNETVVSWCLICKMVKHSPFTQTTHLL